MGRLWRAMVSVLLASLVSGPAAAQLFHDEDDGWCLLCFHRYGGDVNRPGWTPDRPYWHGDDAVPAGMRWQDLEAARAEAAAFDAAVAAAAQAAQPTLPPPLPVAPPRPPHSRRIPHHVPVLVRKD